MAQRLTYVLQMDIQLVDWFRARQANCPAVELLNRFRARQASCPAVKLLDQF